MPRTVRASLPGLLLLLALAGCGRAPAPAPAANGDYRVQVWPLPAEAGSLAADLSRAPGERLLLAWMNRTPGRRNALQFASYDADAGWQSQPRTIAVGQSLMVSGADIPHLRATPDGALWVQWLQADPDQAGGYHAVLARSRDGGMRWQQMTRIDHAGDGGEHGFASLWPVGSDRLGVAWLDGPAAPAAEAASAPTRLRATVFDQDLARGPEVELDAHACDCCQTAVAMTARGALLAWRGHAAGDVRDIRVRRFDGRAWGPVVDVHADGWAVQACPVNGPAVAAQGAQAVVAWYTEAGGTRAVRLARSADAGDHFAAPVTVDSGPAVAGQVAVAMDAAQVWVAWLREDADGQTVLVDRYSPDLARRLQRLEVARTRAHGHAAGRPQLVADARGAWLVWVDVRAGVPHLQGAQLLR